MCRKGSLWAGLESTDSKGSTATAEAVREPQRFDSQVRITNRHEKSEIGG